jgi:flagellar basal body P-ring formation protein FlgA
MRNIFIRGLLIAALVSSADAATLKPVTTLHAQVVRLDDLFTDAGPDADRVLGPGPGPGGRIVVEASQLAYIAHHYGVDWQPASTADRAVLERPGRPLTRSEAMAPLRPALLAAGAPADCDITVASFVAPLVPIDGSFTTTLTDLQYDPGSGVFTANLGITGASFDPIALSLSGRAEAMVTLPVAAVHLDAGTILTAADLRTARLRISQVAADAVRHAEDAVGKETREQVAAGQPLLRGELARAMLVKKGAVVTMLLDSPGIALTAEGQALDAGGEGDEIRVMNPLSHAVVAANVTGANQVRVAPGAMPLIPAARTRAALVLSQ